MYVLGISCFFHDAAACLVRDGALIAAAEEERFTRIKHDSRLPSKAVEFCLRSAGISPTDLAYVGFYERPFVKFGRILQTCLAEWPFSYGLWSRAIPIWLARKLWMGSVLRKELSIPTPPLYCDHHLAHAASSFLASPFEDAVILTLDGVGEWTTTAFGLGRGTAIRLDGSIPFPHSIGLFYSALTAYLGFHVNDAEWKVMGLAGYGRPVYCDRFQQLIESLPDGSFRLNMRYFVHNRSARRIFSDEWCRVFGRAPRQPGGALDQFHFDVACSGQQVTQDIVLNLANALYRRYRVPRLCLAGGVALNGLINWAIRERTGFQEVFVPTAAGDAGGSLGTALFIDNALLHRRRRFTMEHAFWGPTFDDEALAAAFAEFGVRLARLEEDDLLTRTAQMLERGSVVGWFQGRMEFGPRALGARSILCDPRNPAAKETINRKVKFREWFRPFAPAVLLEDAHRYFDVPYRCSLPFMTFVPRVRPEYRALLPAVTHVDGTSRVQTVTEEANGRFYRLVRRFGELTGVPILLNTSFNVRGEPIVCTPKDAYRTFLASGLDALVAGSYIITERPVAADVAVATSRSIELENDRSSSVSPMT